MRFLMKLVMPTAAENPELDDPGFNDRMKLLLAQIKAEKASFSIVDGRRIDYIVVHVADATELPAKAEPFFRWLKAKAEFLPEMSPDEAALVKPRFEALRKKSDTGE